ncbi:MAG: hypothetical protein JWQ15_2077 [Marmoricola sp.]|nr:hypothetical protein [Marmoricola sp.]
MRRTIPEMSSIALAAALTALLLVAGCGDVQVKAKGGVDQSGQTASATPAAAPDTSAGEGDWLLGMTSAGGADAETSSTVYVTYNPSTGRATARELPGVKGASASAEQAAVLVSADRAWAIPDTGISPAEVKSGRPKVYSLADGSAKVIDLRARTGRSDVDPVGWAFDPGRADTLRVVDTRKRVWVLNVAGGRATQEATLPQGPWVFANGFDRNTGEPWVESISSDDTLPAGKGPADTSPVSRNGGTVLPAGSTAMSRLPTSPCRLGAGFTDAAGLTWTFCADADSVSAYYLPKEGKQWTAYGKPSSPVAPIAAAFPLVLPPAE